MRNKAQNWFEGLRNNLVKMIEDHDEAKFKVKRWKHSGKGGGVMSVLKGMLLKREG